ncbi:MAG TPA: OmpH family outer membrane protein [Chitinophagaceae bacterium]|jgi:outer membrane protein
MKPSLIHLPPKENIAARFRPTIKIKYERTKKLFFFTLCLIAMAQGLHAQRYAIVDTKYILDKMPDYKDAQKKLDQFSEQWQKEIEDKQAALDKMYKDFDAEQVMLSDALKKKRQDEIFVREKEVRELQRKRFGFEGDLFKKRQELVKPIQDKVYDAIQKIAVAKQYDFILDKSEGITVIFADPKLDRSEDVLRQLGIK